MKRSLLFLTVALGVVAMLGCASTGPTVPDEDLEAQRRQEAQQFYSFGASYYGQQNWDAAMENFEKALEVDSSYYDPYIAIGNVWRKRRNAGEAEVAYRKAIALDPKKAKGYEALGDFFLEMSRANPALVDSALKVYQQGIAQDESLIDLWNGIAEIYMKQDMIEQADSVSMAAVAKFPDDFTVQRWRADFLYNQKRYKESLEFLLPLVERFCNDPNVNSLREKAAISHAELGEYKQARAQLDTMLISDPTNLKAKLTLGVVLTKEKNYTEAVKRLEEVIAQDPSEVMAYIYVADIRINQGRYGDANAKLKQALGVDPSLIVVRVYQGDILRKQGSAQIGGKALTAVSKPKLEEAERLFKASKGRYDLASGDVAYGSYARGQIRWLAQILDAIEKELFIR